MNGLDQKHHALLLEAQRSGQTDVESIRLCFEVLALASAIDRACAARLSPHRLSEGKFVLLFLLWNQPDGLSPHELASRAGVTRATITGLLDGLERDGLVARHDDKTDRRKVSVRLTFQGQALAGDLFAEHTRWIASLFSGVDQDQRDALSDLLRHVRRNIDQPATDKAATASEVSP